MSDQPNEQATSPLWHTIRLNEFRAPKEPTSEALRQSVVNLWQRLWHREEQQLSELESVPELKSAPRSLLDRLVPTPDELPGAAETIGQLLDEHYADDGPNGPCLVLVVPPHMEIGECLNAWAEAKQVKVIEPPTAKDVLGQPEAWLDAHIPIDEEYVVIPELERYYLRHYRGLFLVRGWVEALWQSGQRCVVTCDSWAWSILEHICPTNLLQPHPVTVAPFEADDLERWIRTQVRR